MTSNKLPSVLTFPGMAQNSLSVERALKHILHCLERGAAARVYTEREQDEFQAAIDDVESMLTRIDRS
jgi:hypothetical protein